MNNEDEGYAPIREIRRPITFGKLPEPAPRTEAEEKRLHLLHREMVEEAMERIGVPNAR